MMFTFLAMFHDCTMCLYSICGTLHSVDQFLNIKLTDISITDPDKYPHMVFTFVITLYDSIRCL